MTLPAAIQNETDGLPEHVYPELAQLTPLRRQILVKLVTNMCSKERQTETQIAIDMEISRSTISLARRNPLFADLLARLTTDVIRGNVDKVVGNLFSIAETNVKANEILLRIADVYRPTQRIMSQSITMSARTQYNNADDMISAFLSQCKAMGLTLERVTELWNAL